MRIQLVDTVSDPDCTYKKGENIAYSLGFIDFIDYIIVIKNNWTKRRLILNYAK